MRKRRTRARIVEQSERLFREGRHEENLALLEGAVRRFPEDPEIRLWYGVVLVRYRKEEAFEQLATAIELEPSNPVRLTRAATVTFWNGETEAARGARNLLHQDRNPHARRLWVSLDLDTSPECKAVHVQRTGAQGLCTDPAQTRGALVSWQGALGARDGKGQQWSLPAAISTTRGATTYSAVVRASWR